MVTDFFTAKDVARILDIYECSARELLDGIIEFEVDELRTLARVAGVSVARLLR